MGNTETRLDGAILSEGFAGLESQAFGLAERAGLVLEARTLRRRGVLSRLAPSAWPRPLSQVETLGALPDGLLFTLGGAGASVGAALRRQSGRRIVQIQNPRMRLDRFDLVVANTHDEIDGPNVLLARTALHRVTPETLEAARAEWAPRLAHLRRPLVSVLVGGSNGRFRLGEPEALALADRLAAMMRTEGVGVALTPSRRTALAVRAILERTLRPLGAFVWDMQGENPYLGLLACADAIVVTADSVSMVSEAAATTVPVMVERLPGRSRRIGLFLQALIDAGRIRFFNGGIEGRDGFPLDDTGPVAAEMCRRLGLPEPPAPHQQARVGNSF
ncbi:mitochondrial fission ELM1 family protein [Acetobacteraceae bacterium KSS8]|uniref:Mitochondrial fission ELM1 family protein n=1 Tax=Endosaccharibacter trunci TaxID=2812733 RepID=A0ABT1W4G0_9PROT|nr:mitochondrial fission ELM1 family protein [Acetobacteraceae bacterium KSS8]